MPRLLIAAATLLIGTGVATAQNFEKKNYNYSEFAKGAFSEVVTVTAPAKMIYLAGIGSEDEKAPEGSNAQTLHVGDPYAQCRYAYDKIRRLLATHGGTLADVVKQTVYVTDVRYQGPVRKCRDEAYGTGPIPANTFLVINGLASPTMLLEIDITAVVAK